MPHIGFVTIQVHDMDAALDFYGEKLGFQVTRRVNYPHFVLLENASCPIALHAPAEKINIDYGNQASVILGIGVDNLAATLQDLEKKGVALIHSEPKPFLRGIFAALRDPSGNIIELMEFRHTLLS